jgi:hypothetical protein
MLRCTMGALGFRTRYRIGRTGCCDWPGRQEDYDGSITKFGLDLGVTAVA